MTKMIHTRQGALAYLAAPFLVFGLLAAMLLFGVSSPFHAGVMAAYLPEFLLLTAWMAFALPAMGVLVRWLFLRATGQRRLTGWKLLILLPAALLMWFPAALLCLPMYLLNLYWLLRGRYPVGQHIRWKPILILAAVLVGISAAGSLSEHFRRSWPAPTAAESFRRYEPEAAILAEVPQGEDAVLIISQSASGVFARDDRGWTLRTPYQTTYGALAEDTALYAVCRNPEEGADVVVINLVSSAGQPLSQPRDSAGSAFTLNAVPLGPNTICTWYAIVDVDVPGYTVAIE